jgi:hypothetical protein
MVISVSSDRKASACRADAASHDLARATNAFASVSHTDWSASWLAR